MKTNISSRRRHGKILTILALCGALFLGGVTSVSAKDKKDKNGYWDPYGNYHRYNDNDGYWDKNGKYHRYSDKKKDRNTDYISKGRQIWEILNN